MNARAERTVAVKPGRTREVVVNFTPERVKAPFLLRCGALTIDYMIVLAAPVLGILLTRYLDKSFVLFKTENTGWLVGALLALTNLVIFPLFSGQSIGKFLTGTRIVKKDGGAVSMSRILVRHLIGYPLTILTGCLGFILSAFNRKGLALHDFLAGTMVVYGRRRVLKKETAEQEASRITSH